MGKITGFLEYARQSARSEPVALRLKNFREFVPALSDDEAGLQGARCMDCGIPFCSNGCPVGNVIPDWNDLVYQNNWQEALAALHATNNFPEWTGRICPAPCEEACTLRINSDPVSIKSIEQAIIDKGWEMGWVKPQPPARKSGKKVAVVGSGPAGLACAQQLARAGHEVTVFEKNSKPGGLLCFGIPDFKLEKNSLTRRLTQLTAEGVHFSCGTLVGPSPPPGVLCQHQRVISPETILSQHHAVVVAIGAEEPRDLPIPGRDLAGVHFALEFLTEQNLHIGNHAINNTSHKLHARGKKVVVIGGGDTGSDCVGTSNRHGAASVLQLELLAKPPSLDYNPVWPYWPLRLRTSSSHEEGCERDWSVMTKKFIPTKDGHVRALQLVRLEWREGKMHPIVGSEYEIEADLVLLAMGFTGPLASMVDAFGAQKDARGNFQAAVEGDDAYHTSVDKLFASGDARRGQSLVVWAIREGRQCARAVDAFLHGGTSVLPG